MYIVVYTALQMYTGKYVDIKNDYNPTFPRTQNGIDNLVVVPSM